ncbi:MAG: diguanylate cyclase [Deltaproteobacteria bacterium]|nr:diguanylate cyclase [Deltaproteobacteria bacterium]
MKEKILIVDDDQTVCRMLSDMMNALGHNNKMSNDGLDALQMMETESFTIVISDIQMPGIDGLTLITRIKEKSPETDIITITGHHSKYPYALVIRTGATDFITKPFGIDELEAKLDRIIRERKIRQELRNKNQELLRLSRNDDLTGLFNRRHFYTRLTAEINRARRQHRPLFLLIFDLDKFKRYNDNHGHVEGDSLLKKIGLAVLYSIRKDVDAGFRYGGDEFAVIIPEANKDQTLRVANRIIQACKNIKPRPIDVSIGIAELTENYDVESFVADADRAMYKAKKSKDKIAVYNE